MIRRAAVAGSWYPGAATELRSAVDGYLAAGRNVEGTLVGLIAPHAGLMYSGPVAAHAYALLRDRTFDVVVLVGPSHFVGFEGVAVPADEGFESPFGIAPVDRDLAAALTRATPAVRVDSRPHGREHSLEMQLPFVQRLAPDAAILPLLMGHQTDATARALAEALPAALGTRRALLVASSDLSHYHDARTAATLDAVVLDHVRRFDPDGLQRALDARPEHACGGGPIVAVLRAARALGARDSLVLDYADSGDVSGDKSAVVGYMAAALGIFTGD
jgi:AmmeMemoRadiSam system protein B